MKMNEEKKVKLIKVQSSSLTAREFVGRYDFLNEFFSGHKIESSEEEKRVTQ